MDMVVKTSCRVLYWSMLDENRHVDCFGEFTLFG
jgi:hypothetical protein